MLVILKFTRWLYNTFAGAMTPTQIAYGLCLGLFLVMMPLGLTKAHTLMIFALVVVTRASLGLFSLTAAIVKPLMLFAGGHQLAWKIGRYALEDVPALHGFWPKALNSPVIALVDLDRYAVMGGFLMALAGSIVLFFPIRQTIVWFRTHVQPRADQYRIVRWWRGFFLTKALSYVFVGGQDSK